MIWAKSKFLFGLWNHVLWVWNIWLWGLIMFAQKVPKAFHNTIGIWREYERTLQMKWQNIFQSQNWQIQYKLGQIKRIKDLALASTFLLRFFLVDIKSETMGCLTGSPPAIVCQSSLHKIFILAGLQKVQYSF